MRQTNNSIGKVKRAIGRKRRILDHVFYDSEHGHTAYLRYIQTAEEAETGPEKLVIRKPNLKGMTTMGTFTASLLSSLL